MSAKAQKQARYLGLASLIIVITRHAQYLLTDLSPLPLADPPAESVSDAAIHEHRKNYLFSASKVLQFYFQQWPTTVSFLNTCLKMKMR
jgi:hypothetical protein